MPGVVLKDGSTIEDTVNMLKKQLQWLLNNLDHMNIKQLFTEYCKIQSENGETQLDGSVINMYDSNGVLRLKMGLNKDDNTYMFYLYNETGQLTLCLDSNGDILVLGSVVSSDFIGGTITIGNDNDVVKADGTGLYAGSTDILQAPFSVDMKGKMKATDAEIKGDITSGSTITGARVRTAESGARIEINENGLEQYGSQEIVRASIQSLLNTGSFNVHDGDGNIVGQFQINLATGIVSLVTTGNNPLIISPGGKLTIKGLSDTEIGAGTGKNILLQNTVISSSNMYKGSSSSDFNRYVTDGDVENKGFIKGNGVNGTFKTADNKTVTVTNGLVTNIV